MVRHAAVASLDNHWTEANLHLEPRAMLTGATILSGEVEAAELRRRRLPRLKARSSKLGVLRIRMRLTPNTDHPGVAVRYCAGAPLLQLGMTLFDCQADTYRQ